MDGADRIDLACVVALAVVAIEGAAGMVWIGVLGREIPTALVGIVATACGALGGALAARKRNGWYHGPQQPTPK